MKKIAEKTQEYYINFINDNNWWFNDATIDDRQSIIHAGSKMKYDIIEQHDATHESEKIKNIISEKNGLISNCENTIKQQNDIKWY